MLACVQSIASTHRSVWRVAHLLCWQARARHGMQDGVRSFFPIKKKKKHEKVCANRPASVLYTVKSVFPVRCANLCTTQELVRYGEKNRPVFISRSDANRRTKFPRGTNTKERAFSVETKYITLPRPDAARNATARFLRAIIIIVHRPCLTREHFSSR